MNRSLTSLVGAVFLAAALTTLITLLAPGNVIALFVAAFIAIFLNGLLASRNLSTEAAAPAPRAAKDRPKSEPRRNKPNPPPRQASAPSGDLEEGTVKWFNRSKGFGFIIRESGEEIFVHQRSIKRSGDGDRQRPTLRDGQRVQFEVANHEKGLQAENVSPA